MKIKYAVLYLIPVTAEGHLMGKQDRRKRR